MPSGYARRNQRAYRSARIPVRFDFRHPRLPAQPTLEYRALAEAELEAQHAAGLQELWRLGEQPGEDGYPHRAAIECQLGFVSRDFLRHLRHFRAGDVRRVAAHQVAFADQRGVVLEGGEHVTAGELHTLAQAGEARVAMRELDCLLGQVGCVHPRLWLVVGIGEGEIAAAGADVYDQQFLFSARFFMELGDGGAAEDLRFLARDESVRPGEQLKPQEFLTSRD